jgi:hypothetical protein
VAYLLLNSTSYQFTAAYTHMNNGKVIQGRLIQRKCSSKIKIYSPIDRTDRRAIVILDGAHNHPKFPATKLSRDGKDLYSKAIVAAGVTALTVRKCDSGMDLLM